MKKIKKWLYAFIFSVTTTGVVAQGIVTGTVIDGEVNTPLPGASVLVGGTTKGVSTDFDGKFSIEVPNNSGTVVISYIGFQTSRVTYNLSEGKATLQVVLIPDAEALNEVVVVGSSLIDLARDRQTPIAVSTIKAVEFQEKIGSGDVSQALVNTPSVYVTAQSSGFGDTNIRVRGFDQDNTAYLLNGQPINGMEDGKMYWSNWSGISDVASIIQVQRGLGSSKLAISSVGGTVNFVTKTTDLKQGGFISGTIANDQYYKSVVAYNTGVSEKGWGTSLMFAHWQGDGYNDGTKGQGQTYFISIGYTPNDKHNFNILLTGAPQWHDQNSSKAISQYLERGRKFNDNIGYLNGEYLNERRNYYHKPVANLNWDFNISEKSTLSTVLYASWGRGGGTGIIGARRMRNAEGYVDWDAMVAANKVSTTGSLRAIRASVNNHSWYGMVSNYQTKLTENLNFNAGFDARTYYGSHFRQITNLLSGEYFTDNNNINLPNNRVSAVYKPNPYEAMFTNAKENQRVGYDNSERINYGGIFSQLEYSKNGFSAFVQGSVSRQSHVRYDRFLYTPENQKSQKVINDGYNVKSGLAYAFQGHTIFGNVGYYSRQPYHDNIYLNYSNTINPLTENEKILGIELGYKFTSTYISVAINAYRTSWKDRFTTESEQDNATGNIIYTTNQGVNQLHSGIEFDLIAKPFQNFEIKWFASVGDWKYQDDVAIVVRDEDRNFISASTVNINGLKVGDAAQTTFGIGAKCKLTQHFSVDADWRYYDSLYARLNTNRPAGSVTNVQLPSYNLMDTGISYKLPLYSEKSNIHFRLNVNNVFDTIYLSELRTNIARTATSTNYKGINTDNQGYFGYGRTWSFSVRYNF